MDNAYIEGLRKDVKRALKVTKCVSDTLGVADTSACLAPDMVWICRRLI